MSTIYNNEKLWDQEWQRHVQKKRKIKRCTRCLYDEETPSIIFNNEGICNYCLKNDQLMEEYPGGKEGEKSFQKVVDEIKIEGRNKKYDVIIGVSGGTDSSYLLHLAKKYGLRPLAVHFDNTWNTTIATENIKIMLEKLDIDLWTYVVDNIEYDDIYKAFFLSGTNNVDVPTDIALAAVLNIAADKFKVKYIFEGHSFRTEGLAPIGWVYMDAKFIDSIHDKFGKIPMRTYPDFHFIKQLKWMLINNIKKIRPLWYLDYNKEEARDLLENNYDWKYYGGHHLENRMPAFLYTYHILRRYRVDMRILAYSASVRNKFLSREEGLKKLEIKPNFDQNLYSYVLKRLDFSEEEFEKVMTQTKKTHLDYDTYKPLFEKLRPFYYLMAKLEYIPWSFYHKYTSKENI